MSGEYRMTMDLGEGCLLYVPNAGLTMYGADGPDLEERPVQPQ